MLQSFRVNPPTISSAVKPLRFIITNIQPPCATSLAFSPIQFLFNFWISIMFSLHYNNVFLVKVYLSYVISVDNQKINNFDGKASLIVLNSFHNWIKIQEYIINTHRIYENVVWLCFFKYFIQITLLLKLFINSRQKWRSLDTSSFFQL